MSKKTLLAYPALLAGAALAFTPLASAKTISEMIAEARAKKKSIAEQIKEARAKKKSIEDSIKEAQAKSSSFKDKMKAMMKKGLDLKPTKGGGLDDMMKKAMGKKDDLGAKKKGPSLEDMAAGKVAEHHAKMRAKAEKGFFGKKGLFQKIYKKGFDIANKIRKGKKGWIELAKEAKAEYLKRFPKEKEEKEETLYDRWKKKKAKMGASVFEMMDAARKKAAEKKAKPKKKTLSIEEMIKAKMGGK